MYFEIFHNYVVRVTYLILSVWASASSPVEESQPAILILHLQRHGGTSERDASADLKGILPVHGAVMSPIRKLSATA